MQRYGTEKMYMLHNYSLNYEGDECIYLCSNKSAIPHFRICCHYLLFYRQQRSGKYFKRCTQSWKKIIARTVKIELLQRRKKL